MKKKVLSLVLLILNFQWISILTADSIENLLIKKFSEEESITAATKGFSEEDQITAATKGFVKTKAQEINDIKRISESSLIEFSLEQSRKIDRTYKTVNDEALSQWLRKILFSLKANSGSDIPFKIKIIQDDTPNAFALPTGEIYIHTGLLNLIKTSSPNKPEEIEGQIASILAHEINHVILRHGFNQVKFMEIMELSKKDSKAFSSPLLALNMAHSREHELEADSYGASLALQAGYSIDDFIEAMKKLNAAFIQSEKEMEEAKMNHPKTQSRIDALVAKKESINQDVMDFVYGTKALREKNYDSAVFFFKKFVLLYPKNGMGHFNLGAAYLLRSIRGVPDLEVMEEDLFFTENDLKIKSRSGRKYDEDDKAMADEEFKLAEKYLFNTGIKARISAISSVFYTRIAQYSDALKYGQKSVGLTPTQSAYHVVLGNAYFCQKNFKEAMNSYTRAISIDSNSYKAYYNLGITLKNLKQYKQATYIFYRLRNTSEIAYQVLDRIEELTGLKLEEKTLLKEDSLGQIKLGDFKESFASLIKKGEQNGILGLKSEVIVQLDGNQRVLKIIAAPFYQGSTKRGIKIGQDAILIRKKYGMPQLMKNLDGSEVWSYPKLNVSFSVENGLVKGISVSN